VPLWSAGTSQSTGACLPATGSSRACLPMRPAARSGRLAATRRPTTDTGTVLATTPAAARPHRSSEAEREPRFLCDRTLALDRDSLNPEIYLSPPGGRQPNQRRADSSGKPFKSGLFFCYKFRRRLHSDTTRRIRERERETSRGLYPIGGIQLFSRPEGLGVQTGMGS
jgi:hypothetical protein